MRARGDEGGDEGGSLLDGGMLSLRVSSSGVGSGGERERRECAQRKTVYYSQRRVRGKALLVVTGVT